MECSTKSFGADRVRGWLCHFMTTSDAGSDTGSERSRMASMKL